MSEDFNIGRCSACGEGLMLIVKNPSNGKLLVMCDDCEAMWPTPEDALANKNRIPYNVITNVVDPTYAEIKDAGWDKFLTVSSEWFDASETGS